jgi:hypothetical protein
MNRKIRQRALRSFLASLLQSELSSRDLRELASELAHGGMSQELSQLILEFVALSDSPSSKHALGASGLSSSTDAPSTTHEKKKRAIEIINKRRLSKQMVRQLMQLASPHMDPNQFPPSDTNKQLLDRFFSQASDSDTSRLVSILEGEPADQYLKGISSRD